MKFINSYLFYLGEFWCISWKLYQHISFFTTCQSPPAASITTMYLEYVGNVFIKSKFVIFSGKVRSNRGFQGPVWIKLNLNSRWQDSLCMTWHLIHLQNEAMWSLWILHTLMQCKIHSYLKSEGKMQEKINTKMKG